MNGDDGDYDDAHDGEVHGAPVSRAWQPHPWWAWHVALVTLGTASLLGGGVALSNAQFGTSLRARACDTSPLAGIALLAVGALLVAIGMQLARLQHPSAVVGLEWRGMAFALPVPLVQPVKLEPGSADALNVTTVPPA